MTFFDGEFIETDWSTVKIYDETPSGTGTVTTSRMPAGGNPDAYRLVRHDWTGPGSVTFAHLNAAAVYDPSTQGPICCLDFAFDLQEVGGAAVAYLALLRQGDTYYAGPYNLTVDNNWSHREFTCLDANDFTRVTGPGPNQPDFAAGGPITFGFETSNGTSAPSTTHTVSHIDNWSVTVHACPVPTSRFNWGAFKATYR